MKRRIVGGPKQIQLYEKLTDCTSKNNRDWCTCRQDQGHVLQIVELEKRWFNIIMTIIKNLWSVLWRPRKAFHSVTYDAPECIEKVYYSKPISNFKKVTVYLTDKNEIFVSNWEKKVNHSNEKSVTSTFQNYFLLRQTYVTSGNLYTFRVEILIIKIKIQENFTWWFSCRCFTLIYNFPEI